MTLEYKTKRIDDLIIRALDNGELGFNSIHTKIGSDVSTRTLTKHLKSLMTENVVCLKTGKTKTRRVYALSEKNKQYAFCGILLNLAEITDTLKFLDEKPCFGFPNVTVLAELRDAFQEISERIDCCLQSQEGANP
jgi:DNA-binding HxlR family transcriptional regulator